MMKALVAEGGELLMVERPLPQPGPGEVLVRVAAAISSMRAPDKRMIYYYFGSKEGLYVAVLEAAKAYARDELTAGRTVFDLAGGGIAYSTSGGFIDDITDEIDEFKAKIISGEIEVPTKPS